MEHPIRSFFTEQEAMEFCNQHPARELLISKDIFSGQFDVYDMEDE